MGELALRCVPQIATVAWFRYMMVALVVLVLAGVVVGARAGSWMLAVVCWMPGVG